MRHPSQLWLPPSPLSPPPTHTQLGTCMMVISSPRRRELIEREAALTARMARERDEQLKVGMLLMVLQNGLCDWEGQPIRDPTDR